MIRIGSLWKKQGQKGPFLAGNFGDAVIMVFPNTKKTAPNQPDYSIVISEKKQQEKPPVAKPAPKPPAGDDDIPF